MSFDYQAAFARHQQHDRDASGVILAAIERFVARDLPGWRVSWAMTGGGCSGWYVMADSDAARREARGVEFLLTGATDETEASGDLSEGVEFGAYDAEGSSYADNRFDATLEGGSEYIAGEVVRLVRLATAHRASESKEG